MHWFDIMFKYFFIEKICKFFQKLSQIINMSIKLYRMFSFYISNIEKISF